VFFAKVADQDVLTRNEFYAVDLKILRELGLEVTICVNPFRIPLADIYVIWWWTWAFFPVLRAKLVGKPAIILGTFDHVLEDGKLERFYRRPYLQRFMIKYALRNASSNVVVSRDQFKVMERDFSVCGLEYSPHVIDTDEYAPKSVERGNFLLSFCWMNTRNAIRKCIPELILAMAKIHDEKPSLKLLICGEKGSDYPELQSLVDSLGAQEYIEFPGVVTKEKKIELMQTCAVYMQPSRVEGFGVAILEAMSCAAPVVSSPVGAVPEVAGDTAILVDGTNPDEIAAATIALLDDPAYSRSLGIQARSRAVRLFSYQRRKNDLDRIINQVTGKLIEG
jgi:glycosyltransferase involved in cell wall biosynthesis